MTSAPASGAHQGRGADLGLSDSRGRGHGASVPEVLRRLRADNAGPHTMENTGRKAYTARSFLHFNRCLRQAVRR